MQTLHFLFAAAPTQATKLSRSSYFLRPPSPASFPLAPSHERDIVALMYNFMKHETWIAALDVRSEKWGAEGDILPNPHLLNSAVVVAEIMPLFMIEID